MMNKIELAVEAIRKGQLVIVADDEDRENEGDLIMAAPFITPEIMAFIVRHTTGIVCVPMLSERLSELKIPPMISENTESFRTAFTVSVDHLHTTTGVSASDRTKTIQALADPHSMPADFRRPGHIFPLIYREGGVLKRAGHTEATIDLCLLAGLPPVGILCELVNDDGTMMRYHDLEQFSQKHNLLFITVAELIKYRRKKEKLVERISEATLPTAFGQFKAYAYRSLLDNVEHLALVYGDIENQKDVLVRVHSECLTGDIFGSLRCDCGSQLDFALERIASEGKGILVYLRNQEGRGIGLGHKLKAYQLQENGVDTVDANLKLGFPVDSREYGIGAQILADFGLSTLRLMTNNPSKYGGIEGYDLKVVERIAIPTVVNPSNRDYLMTKKDKMGHLISI